MFSQEVFYVMFYVCVCVLWQHSRFSGVCLWHGGRGQHIHRAFQRAEIPRLHLDAISWREGSQAKVQQQLINQCTHTHRHTHTSPSFSSHPWLSHILTQMQTHGCCIIRCDISQRVSIAAFWSHVASWAFLSVRDHTRFIKLRHIRADCTHFSKSPPP